MLDGRKVHRYTEAQERFLVNWNDLCINSKMKYDSTVQKEFEKQWKVTLSKSALTAKLPRVFNRWSLAEKEDILQKGTAVLDSSKIPPEVKKEWDRERMDLGLPKVGSLKSRSGKRATQQQMTAPSEQASQLDDEAYNAPLINSTPVSEARVPKKAKYVIDSANATFMLEKVSGVAVESRPVAKRRRICRINQPKPSINQIVEQNKEVSARSDPQSEVEVVSQNKAPDQRDLQLLVNSQLSSTQSRSQSTCIEKVHRKLESIQRQLRRYPGDPHNILLRDLISMEMKLEEYERVIRGLVGSLNFTEAPNFPIDPSPKAIDLEWKSVENAIHATTYVERATTSASQDDSANEFIEFWEITEPILGGRLEPDTLVGWCQSHQKLLVQREIMQILLAVLIFHHIFGNPGLLFDGQHNETMLAMNSLITVREGSDAARRFYLRATKLRFESETFKDKTIPKVSNRVTALVLNVLKQTSPQTTIIDIPNEIRELCEKVIKLKIELLMSIHNYQIRLCRPGAPFQRRWMNVVGHSIPPHEFDQKLVSVCLFPALIQYPAPLHVPIRADGLFSAFEINGPFFPDLEADFDSNSCIVVSKAVVLVEE